MSNIRILLITPYSLDDYGGVQNQILLAKKYLLKKNYEVRIFSNASNDYDNIKPIKIPFNGSKAKVSLKCNKKLLIEAINWCDVVHIHEPFIPLILWRLRTDKKIITTHHASLSKSISNILKILYKVLLKDLFIINTCVSNSSYFQAEALRKYPKVIPNYILFNENIEFNTSASRLTFLGRNEPRKGLNIYLKSIDSYILNHLKPTVISNKYIDKIYVESFTNLSNKDKYEILTETSILIAPNTKNESFGLILLEGISNGCLIICSDIDAFKEVLHDTGIYFKNMDSNSLNSQIKNVISKDMNELWSDQYSGISKFDIEKVFPKIIELYK